MIPYKLYLDLSGGQDDSAYFEVSVISMEPIEESQVDGMVTTRFSLGEIKLSNEPYSYLKIGGDRYKLYDILKSISATSEIHIKFISEYQTVYGYFGLIDFKIDDDQKVITITPTALDQYTDFIENRDTEVELFNEANIIANGNFNSWTDGEPNGWVQSSKKYLQYDSTYINDSSSISIYDRIYINEEDNTNKGTWDAVTNTPNLDEIINPQNGDMYQCTNTISGDYTNIYGTWHYAFGFWISYSSKYGAWMPVTGEYVETQLGGKWHPIFPEEPIQIWQICNNILKGRQMAFSFNFALSGSTERYKKLAYDILLSDSESSDIYRLLSDGSWTKELSGTDKIYYGNNRNISIPSDQLSSYKSHSISINNAPVNGSIQVIFYRPYDADVENTWDENYKLILTRVILSASAIELKSINVNLPYDKITTVTQREIYFTGKTDNDKFFYKWDKPYDVAIEDMFLTDDSPDLSSIHVSSENNLTYQDLITIFDSDRNNPSYKFELSKLTIYRGRYSAHNHRYWYGIAEFSREQYYMADPVDWDQNTDTLIPPEEDAKWEWTTQTNSLGKRLWVRSPFGGIDIPWIKSDKTSYYPKGTTHEYGFFYYEKMTTEKQYPPRSGVQKNNAIGLKELLTQLYQRTHISLRDKLVYSNFFWNDPLTTEEESDLYRTNDSSTTAFNYVVMTDDTTDIETKNVLNKVIAIHTYEFATEPATDEEKTVLSISPKKFIDELLGMTRNNLYWFIDSDKNLHIEHIKYFDNVNKAADMTIHSYDYLSNYSSWEYNKEKMYSKEIFEMDNSGYSDFKKAELTFEKIVTNKRGEDIKGNFSISIITTDLQHCIENGDDIDNGIVLIAYETIDGENNAKYGIAQKSGKSILNGDLSLSTLIQKYGSYEGTWNQGLLNSKSQIFYYTNRVREGVEISDIKGIFLNKIISTKLGIGVVKSRKLDYENELTSMIVNYRINEDSPIEGFGENPIIPELPTIGFRQSIYSDTTETSVVFNGNIIDEGSSPLIDKGFVYSKSSMPTIETGTVVSCGTGIGYYSSDVVVGLTVATTYFVREYAKNSLGIVYGEYQYAFSTLNAAMAVTTVSATNISAFNELINCNVTSSEGYSLIRGVVLDIAPNPTIDNNYINGIIGGEGIYSVYLSTLIPNRTYYARAYVSNGIGTSAYGNEITFRTS